MADKFLRFTIGTSTLRLDDGRFTDLTLNTNLGNSVEYTIVGSSNSQGQLFTPRKLWQGVQFLLDLDEYLTLEGIIAKQNLIRQTEGNHAIQFDNAMYPLVDPTTNRTRAIATGTVTNRADGTIYYYARHNVEIIEHSAVRNGSKYLSTLSWQELDLTA